MRTIKFRIDALRSMPPKDLKRRLVSGVETIPKPSAALAGTKSIIAAKIKANIEVMRKKVERFIKSLDELWMIVNYAKCLCFSC